MTTLQMYDLTMDIFLMLNMQELISISHLNHRIWDHAQHYVQRQIRMVLTSLAPALGDPSQLLRTIAADNGALFRSAPLYFLHSYNDQTWHPKDINIVVPKGKGGTTYDFLPGVHNHTITILESKWPKVLGIIFNSPTTATMITITQQNFYCFYPKMTIARRAIYGLHTASEKHTQKITNCHFDLQQDTSRCLAVNSHQIKNPRGIRVWCWNPEEQETTEIEKGAITYFAGGIAINPSTKYPHPIFAASHLTNHHGTLLSAVIIFPSLMR
ncbi:hypothetical protein L208DRAFT_1380417 [Tricholoma matsutake]|nr:hypothetical protein L208DRAFT_1380417 [Tricholoma matsutake 945]